MASTPGSERNGEMAALVRVQPRLLGIKALLIAIPLALLVIGYLGWRQFNGSRLHTPTAQGAPGTPTIAVVEKSVAVLPFINESSDKEQEYFADGLTDEMINLLSKVPDLRVPARTSSFYFKGKNEKLALIAKDLNVGYVLEGSVRRAGRRLRITAELVRAADGYQVWSERYDRDAADIFQVQDEISAEVVKGLKITLMPGKVPSNPRGTANVEAYNEYLIGNHFALLYTLDGWRRAAAAFRTALGLDPMYAKARARLALVEAHIADVTGDGPGLERAIDDANQAVGMAPDLATVYQVRSILRLNWQWDWAGATADIEKATMLDPVDAWAFSDYGVVLVIQGQFERAIEVTRKALALDPLFLIGIGNIASYQIALGDLASADATLKRGLEIDPGAAVLLGNTDTAALAELRLLQGRPQESRAVCDQLPDAQVKLKCIAQAEYSLGHAAKAQHALDELLLKGATSSTYLIAQTYAWRGETDQAFAWLDKSFRARNSALVGILSDRQMDSLHSDPRYRTLLHNMKLSE